MEQTGYTLLQENLVPFYLLEDKLKDNFATVSRFIADQQTLNHQNTLRMNSISSSQALFQEQIAEKLVLLEKKIVQQISQQLEGRIILAINKNMASFTTRMEQKQHQISQVSQGIQTKLQGMKKTILFEGAKDTQKSINKEVEKIQKKIKNMTAQVQQNQGNGVRRSINTRPVSPATRKNGEEPTSTAPQNYFTEQWVLRIKELEQKSAKTEQFMVGFDKRYYDNISSLKDSWKELGEDILATKKKLTSKQDELRLQLVRLKGIKEFQGAPEEVEQTFKSKIIEKFTDIYQLFGQLVSRTDFQSESQRIKKVLNRHDGQLSDLREEMAKNNDYFTFYANNSDQEDLSAKISALQAYNARKQQLGAQRQQRMKEVSQKMSLKLEEMGAGVAAFRVEQEKVEKGLSRLRQQLLKDSQRIDALEEHNNFTPQKMAKIHNMLDVDFSPSQEELIAKKNNDFGQNQAMKELRGQLSKVKDEIFILSHQLADVQKVKKSMAGLEGRVDKIKVESEEAVLSRKPWVCLSCDRNEKDKQQQDKLRKDASRKKLQEAKALFSKDKSEKLIKLIPSGQEKFEVYEKYREKYLSEGVRLPDIYRQKIGEKDPSLS